MMFAEKAREKEDIEYIRGRVLRKFPLLGVTMSGLKTVADERIGTAATDGKTIYYAPKFFNPLSDEQKVFLYAHEVMHVAFNHILRSKGKNPRLWNIATDAVINQILKSEELPMPQDGVDMAEAINHSAEEMYEKLLKQQEDKKEKEPQQQSNRSQSNQDNQSGNGQQPQEQKQESEPQNNDEEQQGQGNSGQQQNQQQSGHRDEAENEEENEQAGHDNHDIWKKAVEDAEKEAKQKQDAQNHPAPDQASEKKGMLDKIRDLFNRKKPEEKPADEQQEQSSQGENAEGQRQKGNESVYEKGFTEENRQERKKQAEEIRKMLERQKNETMKAQSDARGQSFGPVGEAKAVTDWKRLLKKSVEEDEDRWSYRRSGADNDYMARVEELEEENKSETEVMLDVSGSVNEEMIKEFLRQLKPILKNSKLKVGCFDHRLFDFKEIKNVRDIDSFNVPGGGGTDIDLAVRAFSKKKEVNKIVFTDGEGDMPRNDLKNVNVIWLIYDNHNFNPVCGKVIYVDKSQISRPQFKQVPQLGRCGR